MTLVSRSHRSGIDILTIEHPPVNSFGHALRLRFAQELSAALANPSANAVLVTAVGRMFSAGADIREFGTPAMTAPPNLRDIAAVLDGARKPVVIVLHGVAAGGALELALACHYRLAAPDAQLGLPEVTLGIVPGAGGTQRLPRLVGAETALEMITTGRFVPAQDAYTSGLVDALVAADPVEGAIDFLNATPVSVRRTSEMTGWTENDRRTPAIFQQARDLAQRKSPGLIAPGACINCIEAAVALPFDEGLAREQELFVSCLESEQSDGLRHAFFAEREVSRIPGLPSTAAPRPIERAAVIGCGTMGQGIAISLANAGIPVRILEAGARAASRGMTAIQARYESRVKRGRITGMEAADTLARISSVARYEELNDADIVIEAVFEEMDVKQDVFRRLDANCKPGAILATNTSTLDVNAIAAVTGRPHDVVGTHFFSPADVMKLMENVRGSRTAPDTIATVMQLSRRLKKVGVLVGVCDGFVGNRMLFPYFREAEFLLEEGATPKQVDHALTQFGFAMGPFAVGDLAGLDVGWRIRKRQAPTRDANIRYSPLADRICAMGRFGQKTGAGWYRYASGSHAPQPDPEIEALIVAASGELGIARRDITDQEIVQRCMYPLINEGARILEEGIALRPGDIDVIWLHGYGFPRHRGGPMHYADRVGTDEVLRVMQGFHSLHGDHMKPAPVLERLGASGTPFGAA